MKYSELKTHLNAALNGDKVFASAYVVFGDDAWLRHAAVTAFKGVIAPDFASFNISLLSVTDGIDALQNALDTLPVFDTRRVVVLGDVNEKLNEKAYEKYKARLEEYIAHPNPDTILVALCDDGVNKGVSIAGAVAVDCSRLGEREIAQIAEEILRKPPARSIQPEALRELISRTQSDMSRISTELEKLKAYSDAVITRADVVEMVAAEPDVQIFELSQAVSLNQADRALVVLNALADDGVRPMTIINLLYGHYRKMLHIELHKTDPDTVTAALLGVKPGALYHTKKISQNYSQVRLKKCVDYLHSLQLAVLTGKRNEGSALHEAVLTLLNVV